MRKPAVGLAFILVQAARGPEALFAHVMCLPTSSPCMQSITIKEWGHCLCSLQRCLFISLFVTCPFSHTGSFQVTVLEATTFPGEMTRQHRQMIQAVMRSVPPRQVMLVPCPPGPHFKVLPDEWGRSPPNPEASAWTPACRGRHHQSLPLSGCAHSHCIRHRLSRQGTPALGFSTLSL